MGDGDFGETIIKQQRLESKLFHFHETEEHLRKAHGGNIRCSHFSGLNSKFSRIETSFLPPLIRAHPFS
jgi:hypothetical protein